jgi:hypothetical protein
VRDSTATAGYVSVRMCRGNLADINVFLLCAFIIHRSRLHIEATLRLRGVAYKYYVTVTLGTCAELRSHLCL